MEKDFAGLHHGIGKLRVFALTAALLACTHTPLLCLVADNDTDSQPGSYNAPAAAASVEPRGRKVVHDGSINDVSAIGNRNVGCSKGAGNWYSLEKQIAWGKQISQQVESQSRIINDPVLSEFINRVGQNIVRNSDAHVPFTIKVIDSDDVNAFALPGGFFFVNSGLILAADNEAELAGVMAHEIGHVAACHAARENTRANLMEMITVPLIITSRGAAGYGVYEGAGLAVPLTFLHFSREFEAQADYLGVQYMYKAGYDPQAFISFFEKLEAREKKKPGTISKAFSTHPQTPDRIERSQEEIANILPPRPEYKLTTSEFDNVKARLLALENRHKVPNEKDNKKPTLRQADKNGSGDTSGADDGRPPLKRRQDDAN
ncbi:MAG TPA: M48 family metallopeptidase [Terriglobales bacterium]|nr:M48 family metallopeptidase [Terriglobales bacterium]